MAYSTGKRVRGGSSTYTEPSMQRRTKPHGAINLWPMMGLGATFKGDANIHRDGRAQAKEYMKYKGTYGV